MIAKSIGIERIESHVRVFGLNSCLRIRRKPGKGEKEEKRKGGEEEEEEFG